MHGLGTRMLLKECLDQGVSKTELSRRFGVSRRTIYEWIETGQLDRDLSAGATRYSRRAPRSSSDSRASLKWGTKKATRPS